VLAGVQDEQQVLVLQVAAERTQRALRRLVPHAERVRDRLGQQSGVGQLAQLDQPDAVRERPVHVGGDPEGQPRLADATDPRQRQQPSRGEQPLGLGQLSPAPDKARHLGR
jgi:hypothetical protein